MAQLLKKTFFPATLVQTVQLYIYALEIQGSLSSYRTLHPHPPQY